MGANRRMVDIGNLQAMLVRPALKSFFAVLLFRVVDAEAARVFLRELRPRISSGANPYVVGTPVLNISFGWRAIATLLDGSPNLDASVGKQQFEPYFTDSRQAPDALADQLGFSGESAPSKWWANFRTSDIDVAIYLACDNDEQRTALVAELRGAASGLTELSLPDFAENAPAGYLPPGGRLHFGYRDGITAPDIDWADAGRTGATDLREFVLGYPTDDYPTAPYPPGPWRDFATDGSFACFTWIEQDVARFETFLTENAAQRGAPPGTDAREFLAAQLLGRWRDGTPLALYPRVAQTPPAPDNDFGYADDPTGSKCPLTAHVRVAYSRDQPLSFANASRFPKGPPRLLRRGFSYGKPYAGTDDGEQRGLFGIFCCARINEQFYTVLRWMQETSFSPVFDKTQPARAGQDRLIGSRQPSASNPTPASHLYDPAGMPTTVSLQPFIRYRGVVVLFMPSLSALDRLSRPS